MKRIVNKYSVILLLISLLGCSNAKVSDQTLGALDKAVIKEEKTTNVRQNPTQLVNKDEDTTNKTEADSSVNPPKSAENTSKIYNPINWTDFFDAGDQTQPSNKLWDLKGEQVEIQGWMGEILSVGQGWFLLVPAPGAECPFCSEDESYWNEIMIVYVKDNKNLRYIGEPVRVHGRLDVGVKIDESNYKTMFRLYDAVFESM